MASVASSPSFLTRYPYLANSLLACGIMGIGDLTAQTIERRSASRTPPRRGCSGTSQSDSRSNRVVGNNVSTHDYDLTRTAVLCSYRFFAFFSVRAEDGGTRHLCWGRGSLEILVQDLATESARVKR